MADMPDLDLLRSFVTAVELESLTAVAERLGLSQPTVSKHIAELEARYGTRLLHRDGRGVRATPVSLRFVDRARAILDQLAVLEGADAGDALPRVVRVALPPTVAEVAVVPLVSAVQARDAALRLSITEGFSAHAGQWVRQGGADTGVVYGLVEMHGLSVLATFGEALHVVLPARSAQPALQWAPGARIGRAALEAMDFVLPGAPHGLRVQVDRMARQYRLRLRVVYEVASLATVRKLVLAGRAATVLPFAAVAEEVRAGRLLLARTEEGALVRNLDVVAASARPRSADIRLVMDELCAVLDREVTATAHELQRLGERALRIALD